VEIRTAKCKVLFSLVKNTTYLASLRGGKTNQILRCDCLPKRTRIGTIRYKKTVFFIPNNKSILTRFVGSRGPRFLSLQAASRSINTEKKISHYADSLRTGSRRGRKKNSASAELKNSESEAIGADTLRSGSPGTCSRATTYLDLTHGHS